MSDIVIFTGPTLTPAEAGELIDARILPPAAHGDVLRAALGQPRIIGIVDGVFDRLPAIWHKEILWAMSRGIAVYGAASMGALRACELAPFGMRGVGAIFQAFERGELEDDDEVAVLHADVSDDFRNLSDAMVDIRATLSAAVEAGVVSQSSADELVGAAKATFYPDRRLRSLLQADRWATLRAWVAEHRVSQKRLDAFEMLDTIRREASCLPPPGRPAWTFQHTQYWETAYRRVLADDPGRDAGQAIVAASERDDIGHLLDESRLDPDRHRWLEDRALLGLLAAGEAERSGVDRSVDYTRAAVEEMRLANGLDDDAHLRAWLDERGLTTDDLGWIARRWADHRWIRRTHDRAVPGEILRVLQETGGMTEVSERAERKRQVADHVGGQLTPPESELVSWYFSELVGHEPPAHVDAWAKQHGWRDRADLTRALGREWQFRHHGGS